MVWFAIFVFGFMVFLAYMQFNPNGGWGDDEGKGRWGRWKPKWNPPGPPKLPSEWTPPHVIPDWMEEEQDLIEIRRRVSLRPAKASPVRTPSIPPYQEQV